MAQPWFGAALTAAVLAGSPATAAGDHKLVVDRAFGTGGALLHAGPVPTGAAPRPAGGVALAIQDPRGLAASALLESGALDTGFGRGGRAVASVPAGHARTAAVAVDSAGRVVVVGVADVEVPHPHPVPHELAHSSSMAVARFTADGRPDPAFGDRGVALVAFPEGDSGAGAVVALPDGRLAVGGWARGGAAAALAVLDAAGAPDLGFGSAGRVVADVVPGVESVRGVLATPPGPVIAGQGAHGDVFAARLKPDGAALDPAFGEGGARVLRGPAPANRSIGILAGADGRVLLPGRFGGRDGVLALDFAGRVDAGFGDGGLAAVLQPPEARTIGLVRAAATPDGGSWVVSEAFDPLTRRSIMTVERLDPQGRPSARHPGVDLAGLGVPLVRPAGVLHVTGDRMLAIAHAVRSVDGSRLAVLRLRRAGSHAPKRRRCATRRQRRCR